MKKSTKNILKNEKSKSGQRGFFQLLALVIILVVILAIAGFNPVEVWNSIIRPVIEFFFNAIIKLFDIAVLIVSKAVGVFTK